MKELLRITKAKSDRRLDAKASLIAQVNAAQRAAESMQPPDRRLLNDTDARYFVSHPGLRKLIVHPLIARISLGAADRIYGGVHAHIVLRARYAEELRMASAAQGIEQLVLLGAGFDSTGLRAEASFTVFEVDAPPTQRAKRTMVGNLPKPPNSRIVWAECDFETNKLQERLVAAGFDCSRRSLVIWLGVTFYLTPAAIEMTLDDLAVLCAPGSVVLLDYGGPDIVRGANVRRAGRRNTRFVARHGEPYRAGFVRTEIEALLSSKGFGARDHVCSKDLVGRYAPARGVWCSTDDRAHMVTAERIQPG